MFRPTTVQQPKELLAFLFASLPEVEKNKMRQSLKFEAIRVNGRATTQFDHPLRPGDVASMRYEKNLRTCNRLPAAVQVLIGNCFFDTEGKKDPPYPIALGRQGRGLLKDDRS